MAALVINGIAYPPSTVTGDWEGINIARATQTDLTFTNNTIVSVNQSGYLLQAGNDASASTDNNLDGEIISGNKLTWNGTGTTSITHGLFTGHMKNVIIKYNYVDKAPMGIIRKSTYTMNNTSGGIFYNIVKNPIATAAVIKGMNGVCYYNNTFYSSLSGSYRGLVDIYSNTDYTPSVPSTSAKIKNNIFYTTNQIYNIRILDAACLTGFESDYNVFYCAAGTPMFSYLGAPKTFAQWQALNFDTNSVVINPNFIDTTAFVPSARLNYGTNLGTPFQDGLSTSAVWTLGVNPAVTTQNGVWQAGARVYAAATGPEWYVSTSGNDSNIGTISQPFRNIQTGINAMTAGGTLWIRGGTYTPTATSQGGIQCAVYLNSTKAGSSSNLTKIFAYNNETVIVDASNLTSTSAKVGILLYATSYCHLKGLRVTNVRQYSTADSNGIDVYGATNCRIENCKAYGIHGYGIGCRSNATGSYFLRCDSYNNYDPLSSSPGDNADGFDCGYISNNSVITYEECRAWDNSDDGFDAFNPIGSATYNSYVKYINCWAWGNGWQGSNHSIIGGNGGGFKPGPQDDYGATGVLVPGFTWRRIYYNCISVNNRITGYNQNASACKVLFQNCISAGHPSSSPGQTGWFMYPGNSSVSIRNCVALNDGTNFAGALALNTNNSWTLGLGTISLSNFVSTDATQLTASRGTDGVLPVITYLKPTSSSVLLARGLTTGQYATDGAGNGWSPTPAIGPFEYSGSVPNTIPTVVTNTTSAITSTTATGNGNVTATGGLTVTARGVCWSTISSPTTANFTASGGSGTGVFTASMTGLVGNTQYYVRAYATNSLGTAYGVNDFFITTSGVTLPAVTTTSVINITYNSAQGIGYVDADGGGSITARGIVYGLGVNPNITTGSIIVDPQPGLGLFGGYITGLTPSTLYHVRAYTTNSFGTAYGADIPFYTLSLILIPELGPTTVVTNITTTTATSGGDVISDGGAALNARGICISSINTTPTTADNTQGSGTVIGSYSVNIIGLSPSTLYYVRAYATNSVGTGYGTTVQIFTTLPINLPTVVTTTVTAITSTTASSGGNITNDGGATITAKGVVWSTLTAPTIALATKTSDGTGIGVFTSSITGLTQTTTYYIRAYATNSQGTSYGNELVFLSSAVLPTAIINSYNNITFSTINVTSDVTSDGGSTVIEKGVVYGTLSNPTTANSVVIGGSGTGSYVVQLTGLDPNTTYYMRAYAINSIGTTYSPENSFITDVETEVFIAIPVMFSVMIDIQLTAILTEISDYFITEDGHNIIQE